jgi:hypothetical protein|tara:strand:- start:689 stop:877 length:189 start_codon:yes stop_codon:yes gene_type:complete
MPIAIRAGPKRLMVGNEVVTSEPEALTSKGLTLRIEVIEEADIRDWIIAASRVDWRDRRRPD